MCKFLFCAGHLGPVLNFKMCFVGPFNVFCGQKALLLPKGFGSRMFPKYLKMLLVTQRFLSMLAPISSKSDLLYKRETGFQVLVLLRCKSVFPQDQHAQ